MEMFAWLDIMRQAVSRNRHRFLNTPLPCLHSLGAQDSYFNTLTARDFRITKCNCTSFFIDSKLLDYRSLVLRYENLTTMLKLLCISSYFGQIGKNSIWSKVFIKKAHN